MRRRIVIGTIQVFCVLATCTGWAAESSDNAKKNASRPTWVRRQGQAAEVRPEQLAEFRERSGRSAELEPALLRHHVKNLNLFVIELDAGKHYAFWYYEYVGKNFGDDMQRLEQEETYKKWAEEIDSCLAGDWSDVESVFYTDGQQRMSVAEDDVTRIGQVVGLRPEMAAPYILLHAHTWPGVLAAIREGNIRNYSIFLVPVDSKMYLFAYLEYVGSNFKADMAGIGSDPETKAWIQFTDEGCQLPLSTRKPGEWWARMERLPEER